MVTEEKDGYEQALEVFDEIDRELIEAEAIKARLLNQLKTGYIMVPFRDSNGEFSIKVRIPEPEFRNRLWVLFEQINLATNNGDLDSIVKRGEELADKIALLTPDLEPEYWKAGRGYNSEVLQKILGIALGIDPVRLEDLKFFSGSLVGEDFAMMLRWVNLKGPSEWASLSDEDKIFWGTAWRKFKEAAKR
jgi:hypothetical protein